MYTVGVKPLSISTYSPPCASQLVFDAIFSVVINSEKLGIRTLKSIIFITILASTVAIHPDSSETKRDEKNPVGKNEHTIGFTLNWFRVSFACWGCFQVFVQWE
ncbi:hypothetical protein Goshw_006129 [Gossypium schwendimanii]|uniref:Uncharacterized protein n=1 Tax=Gossypium schwendimanii TaxID=34291 RepID=A0A7J9LKL1_GOSSC|nr:hypothetical protein [Gossypium schwendimanii]